MQTDFNDHPFSPQNVVRESGASDRSERAWLKWCADAERLFGHDIDGNDVGGKGCGYSLDEAYDHFCKGTTPHAYVAMAASRDRYFRAP
jgi:hypothetical protein